MIGEVLLQAISVVGLDDVRVVDRVNAGNILRYLEDVDVGEGGLILRCDLAPPLRPFG